VRLAADTYNTNWQNGWQRGTLASFGTQQLIGTGSLE